MPPHTPYRVLFVCTGNSARSILAEFILNTRSHGRFIAFSAGSNPTGAVNPYVTEILRKQFHADASAARSKSLREFEGQHFDFIITLCDKTANRARLGPIIPLRRTGVRLIRPQSTAPLNRSGMPFSRWPHRSRCASASSRRFGTRILMPCVSVKSASKRRCLPNENRVVR